MNANPPVPSCSVRKLQSCLQRFSRAKILVIGDLIVDHYIWGKVHRVSPEAPVPVVHVQAESYRLGGAANVFHNILTLGGHAELCGVVGADADGKQFIRQLQNMNKSTQGIIVDPGRPTIKKSRVVAHNQQIVRYDVEQSHTIKAAVERKALKYIAQQIPHLTGIVISDYAKGMITATMVDHIRTDASRYRVPIIVDPKVEHMSFYSGVTVVTPNHWEARQAAGLLPTQEASIEQIGFALRDRLQCQTVLITRGEEGMSIFQDQGRYWTIPAVAKQVYDVTGAGDTVVSTLALALSAGANLPEAAILANQAAGIVVGMLGTATVSRQQVQDSLRESA
ncbi:MAG: D-glycero-beta-D-manno-heptose-7-phosphate kinase [Nitrospiraceae bacterium]|nr:D-glycero-beta-D-manno-heptose-7-phosphate kinase [Nitrospiraceae bacterium]